ncbi:MAG: DNA translocase FtsK [Lachnospiraceae bacterium]|nr:DNA translocase FtsK [Lachnospiraceae bacterium]
MIRKEILLLAAFACQVILLLSNFHLCGAIGEFFYGIMRGLFGILGYVFPVYLFLCTLFYIPNRGDLRIYFKLFASLLVYFLVCGLVQLVSLPYYDVTLGPTDYYRQATETVNGGFFGGLVLKLCYPTFGVVGSYLVLLVLTAIGLVFITEKSILKPIRRGGRKVYDTAREDRERRRIMRAEREEREPEEEERTRRSVRKVSGVAFDTHIGKEKPVETLKGQIHGIDSGYRNLKPTSGEKVKPAKKDREEPVKKSAEEEILWSIPIHKGTIPARKEEKPAAAVLPETEAVPAEEIARQVEEILREEDRPTGDAQVAADVISAADALTLEPDYRTLSELASLDELHSSFREQKEAEEEPLYWQPAVRQSEEIFREREEEAKAEPEEMSSDTPEISGVSEDAKESDEFSKEDVRRVTTGGGKVIEADIDPGEDPIEIRRREAGEKKAESGREVSPAVPEAERESIWKSGLSGERSASGGVSFTPKTQGFGGSAAPEKPASSVRERPKKVLKPYEAPPRRLLALPAGKGKTASDEELRKTAAKLQQTLRNFGVGVTVTNISCGPSVTRYELHPEQGVKVNKIVSLSDDIKLNLAATDIRIEAPIPGKAAVGIEVPNKENQTVFLREIIESPEFAGHPSRMAFALGRDIGGQCVVADLAKMPHLLIAGATGSGKSVCINTLIMSILYKALPSEVELIMIDPKVVELSVYNGIPHLKLPVVTDPKKAAAALNWAVAEMNNRYKKFADYNVRDLKGYNEKLKKERNAGETEEPPLPQIVIIVDELADLMMVAPGEVEEAICRLAQMARAAGLHLVLATQRPSVNVITGLIKANVPSRIAFSVSSGVDSRTIIDMNGAEKLLGKGDMLFYPSGYQKPVRVQGAFVSDREVSDVVAFLSERGSDTEKDESLAEQILAGGNSEDGREGAGSPSERDSYFAEAGRFILEKEKASIGMLQRNFKIGFNRAARIVDQLEAAGVVGPEEGTKARKVLMTRPEFEEFLRDT